MTRFDSWRSVQWPNDSLVCVSIGLAFEAFELRSQYTHRPTPGIVDDFSLSFADYGARVGVWRLLDYLDREGISAYALISGLAAEKHPHVVRAIADKGHELAGHGWVNDRLMIEAADAGETEAEVVERSIAAIEAAANGQRVSGWYSPADRGSPETKVAIAAAGLLWCGDDASDDLPFIEDVGGRSLVILPKANLPANDLGQWLMPANPPSVFAESFCDTFDAAYEEAQRGRPQWVEIMLHCHMAGRLTFMPTLRRVVEHVKGHDAVWWAQRAILAQWALDQDMRRPV